MPGFAQARRAGGFSLIEVMVAVVVFSLGLLGLALMQLKGAQFTKESGSRTGAVLQARSIADAMRANPDAAKAPWPSGALSTSGGCPYCYDGTLPAASSTITDQVARNDLEQWVQRLKAIAPGPSAAGAKLATISAETDGSYTIRVSWNGLQNVANSQDVSYSFSYVP